ncbi:hypothetical protein [Aquamicrobium terrae]|uniref:DUF945 domain-containing protein n=1 Tax=Aquamicrobium terrae TaxID=1324945 RepID=A0ABV2MTJ8_9HYPH
MSLHSRTWHKLAVSTILFGMALAPASAQDTGDVAARLKATLAEQGFDLEWTGISGDASSMSLQGVSMKPAGTKEGFTVGEVKLEGITEADGGYKIETVSTQAYSRNEGDLGIEMSPFIMHGVVLPAEGSNTALGGLMFYRSAELANLVIKSEGKTAFSVDDIAIEVTEPASGQPMTFTGTAPKFTGDLTLVKDPKFKDAIEALGYQNISGNIALAGLWNPEDGRMDFSKYDITVDGAGTFGMTFSLGGYTAELVKSMQELQKKMAEAPEGADNSAQGMAMLGLMQQLSFNSASIRFADDSLTNKVLDYVGKQQGMSGKDVANQAKAIVPFGLAQLNNPDLTTQASAAVNQYLDDPRSLEIMASPTSPVPFAMIMADAMSNPVNLTKTLAVQVKANEN